MATWQVQQAKTKLSELIADAQTKGPQIITKHGTKTAVVLSVKDYETIKQGSQPVVATPSAHDVLFGGPPLFETEQEYQEFLADCLAMRQDTGRPVEDLFFEDETTDPKLQATDAAA